MNLPPPAEPVPLRPDGGGGFRVGDSRVPLEVVLGEYQEGAGPEGIVHAYPTLRLADVYAVIAYYLRHQEEVDDYLRKSEAEAARLRQEIESRQTDRDELRAKLWARWHEQGKGRGSTRG